MKKISIFLQSKGGTGKSTIATLAIYSKMQSNETVYSILVDSSLKAKQNLERHIQILGESNVKDWAITGINSDELKKANFFDIFEEIAKMGHDNDSFVIDLGAGESHTKRQSFIQENSEFSPENLAFFAQQEQMEIRFNVIVSGSDDCVNENLEYFDSINKSCKSYFEVNCIINDYTLKNEGDSSKLKAKIIASGLAEEGQVIITGYTGNRLMDNPYLEILSILNTEKSIIDPNLSFGTKLRLNKILTQLKTV
jgi:hypothetical protein